MLLLLAVSVYLISPAFTAVHVEGFSGQVQSLAMILAEQGSIQAHDLARPVVSQFIFVTRPGVVDLLAGADVLFGYTGDLGFRILGLVSLAAIFFGSCFVAGRVGQVSPWLAAFVCVLTPGLTEVGFYFNDNLVSAGFGALALVAGVAGGVASFGARASVGASAPPGSSTSLGALAGALLGLAILCRLDALLLLPLLVLLMVSREEPPGATVRRLLAMLLALFATQLLAAWVNHISVLDVFRLPKRFMELTHVSRNLPGLHPTLFFFGTVTPVLVLIGARLMWRRRPTTDGWRPWAWMAALYAYPLLVLAYVLTSVFEIRYILPLLGPLVALHGGAGLGALTHAFGEGPGWRRRCAVALTALFLVVAVWPPTEPRMHDGPRSIVGRLWTPLLWERWQATVRDNMATLAALVQALDSEPRAAVITAHWDDEFYLRLRLFERGYREVPPPPPCRTMSRYVREGHEVWHVRLHSQYNIPPYEAAFATTIALAEVGHCPALASIDSFWLTTLDVVRPDISANGITDALFEQSPERVLWHTPEALRSRGASPDLTYRTMRVAKLTRKQLDALVAQAQSAVVTRAAAEAVPPSTLTDRYVYAFTHGRESRVYSFVMQRLLRRPAD